MYVFLNDQLSYLDKRSRNETEEEVPILKPMKSFRILSRKKHVSESAYSALLREKQKLADQVERYQTTWMRKLTCKLI